MDVWTDPEEAVQTDGHPVGKKLFHYGLCAAQEKFWICITGLVHQTLQKVLHYLCEIKQVSMEGKSQQRCHCTSEKQRNRKRGTRRVDKGLETLSAVKEISYSITGGYASQAHLQLKCNFCSDLDTHYFWDYLYHSLKMPIYWMFSIFFVITQLFVFIYL